MNKLKEFFSSAILGKTNFYICIGILFLLIAYGSVIVFPSSPYSFGLSRSLQLVLAILALICTCLEKSKSKANALALACVVLTMFYLVTDVTIRSNSFVSEFFPFLIFISLSSLFYFLGRNFISGVHYLLPLLSMLSGILGLVFTTQGKLIFTDDHPCFFYRLTQLKEHFPFIPFYNLDWNGGVEAREFFASGVLNMFMIFAPFIYMFDIETIYTYLVIFSLFVLLPISLIFTCRNFKLSQLASFIVVTLGLSHSLFWYRWALTYGTMGFIMSMILVPINLSLIRKLIDLDKPVPRKFLLLVSVTISLMLLWSLSSVLFILPGLAGLFFLSTSVNKKSAVILMLLLVCINAPWMATFYKVSNVGKFLNKVSVEANNSGDSAKFKTLSSTLEEKPLINKLDYTIQKNLLPVNPIVIIFGIAGLSLWTDRRSKFLLIIYFIGACGLGFIISLFKPHLELERMIVPLSLVLVVPAAEFLSIVITIRQNKIIPAICTALLCFGPFWIWRVATNQTSEKFTIEKPLVKNLAEQIKLHSRGGRTLFSGFFLHELNGGHLAPLPYWTKTGLVASGYQHDKWNYVDVIPAEYRERGKVGILEYLDLMNVSSVVTNDKFWRKWFRKFPENFTEVWKDSGLVMFKLNEFRNNYFHQGAGEIISSDVGEVRLRPLSDTVVLKFNYLSFLQSSNCVMSVMPVSTSLNFIKLENCPINNEVVIKSLGMVDRFSR